MADEMRGNDARAVRFEPDEDDAVLQRVRATLSPMPAVDPMSVARVLSAVHGRALPRRNRIASMLGWLRGSPLRMAGSSTALVMALLAVVLVGRNRTGEGAGAPSVATAAPTFDSGAVNRSAGASTSVQVATARANPEGAVPVQFTLDLPTAASVAVVGDFNEWNTTAAPMQQLPGSNVWTITLVLSPGRHVYSFVVNGETWIADPRAPRAADSDFGKPGSVLLVTPR